MRLLPCLLLPALVLTACGGSGGNAPAPTSAPAAATPTAPAGAAAGVAGFDILDAQGGVTGTWTQAGAGTWTVNNPADGGSSGSVTETGRSDCCINFTAPDGSPITADLTTRVLTLGGAVSFPIANVR